MIPEFNKLILSRYIISRHIASGGMADVYEAKDIVIDKLVALKFLKEKSIDNDLELEQFKNEARITSIFNHPHIMRIYNVGDYNYVPFVSYELLKGKSLKDIVDNRGKLTFDEAIDYMLQILDAVSYMHEKSVLHNDLKPDNIFVLRDGSIKICDFGIATHISTREVEEVRGTVKYLAPEVVQYRKYSIQSDIYSLGIILFELLTGRTPYNKETINEILDEYINHPFPSLRKYLSLPNIDDLDYVIGKATNRIVTSRYKSAKEFMNDLNTIKKHGKLKRGIFNRIFKK